MHIANSELLYTLGKSSLFVYMLSIFQVLWVGLDSREQVCTYIQHTLCRDLCTHFAQLNCLAVIFLELVIIICQRCTNCFC